MHNFIADTYASAYCPFDARQRRREIGEVSQDIELSWADNAEVPRPRRQLSRYLTVAIILLALPASIGFLAG